MECKATLPLVTASVTLPEIVRQPFLQLVKYVVLGRRIDPLMPQRLLCFATIALGELRADKAPEVMGLDFFSLFR